MMQDSDSEDSTEEQESAARRAPVEPWREYEYDLGETIAQAVCGLVRKESLLQEVVERRKFILREEWDEEAPPLLKDGEHRNKVRQHQLDHIVDVLRFKDARTRGQEVYIHPEQQERMKNTKALKTSRPLEFQKATSLDEASHFGADKGDGAGAKPLELAKATRLRQFHDNDGCAICSPVATGKTYTAMVTSICMSMSTLFVTISTSNVHQVFKSVCELTNIAKHVPLSIFQSTSSNPSNQSTLSNRSKSGDEMMDLIVNSTRASHTTSSATYQSIQHCLDGAQCGFVIIDNEMFRSTLPGKNDKRQSQKTSGDSCNAMSEERKKFVLQIAASDWGLIVLDEASELITDSITAVLTSGQQDNFFDFKSDGTKKWRQIKLCYSTMVLFCGVFFRQQNGSCLDNFPVVNKPLMHEDLVKQGLIANMHYVFIRMQKDALTDDALYKRHAATAESNVGTETKEELKQLTRSKLRMLDRIVTYHMLMGHKIMIYCERKVIYSKIKQIYGDDVCHSATGSDSPSATLKALENLKNAGPNDKRILVTTNCFNTGIDVTDLQVVIGFKPWKSYNKTRQRAGRAERQCRSISDKPGYYYELNDWTEGHKGDDNAHLETPLHAALIEIDGAQNRVHVIDYVDMLNKLDSAIAHVASIDGAGGVIAQPEKPASLFAYVNETDSQKMYIALLIDLLSKAKLNPSKKRKLSDQQKNSSLALARNGAASSTAMVMTDGGYQQYSESGTIDMLKALIQAYYYPSQPPSDLTTTLKATVDKFSDCQATEFENFRKELALRKSMFKARFVAFKDDQASSAEEAVTWQGQSPGYTWP